MIVVLDTNIWLSELGLKSGAAAAVQFYLHQSGSKLAIPEVIRLEVEKNLRQMLRTYIKDISTNFSNLLTVFGTLKEVVLPSDDQIEQKVREIFDAVKVEKIEAAFSIDSARNALLKTIEKVPPCDKTQEFKDAVLWENCLILSRDEHVVLVTADKAFYKERAYENGLAPNLFSESKAVGHGVSIRSSMKSLLQQISAVNWFDAADFLSNFYSEFNDSISQIAERNGFVVLDKKILKCNGFATDDPNRIFLDFELEFGCADIKNEGRLDAKILIRGDGTYSVGDRSYHSLRHHGEQLSFVTSDGVRVENRNHNLYAEGIVLGHKEVHITIRYPILGV